MFIGCVGINVNTGAVGGVICLLEEHLNRPLQWLVCMMHANELPLRHLINKVDGVTQGTKGFSGIIGRALMTCELLPVENSSQSPWRTVPIWMSRLVLINNIYTRC